MGRITVFFSTLNGWLNVGSLHHALDIYKKLAEDGWDVSFCISQSISEAVDFEFDVKVLSCCPRILNKHLNFIYQIFMPLIHFWKARKTSVILINHLYHNTPAIWASRLWGAKVIARCGMVYGECAETLGKRGSRARKRTRKEKWTFKHADRCFVPTKELADWIVNNYGIERDRVVVIPNYVDTDLFKPESDVEKDIDVICVGRLVPKKRHKLLLESLARTDVKIHIIGNGKLEKQLNDFAKQNLIDLTLTPRVENSLLPRYFNRSKIYVNVAQWEGHPKAMIEAMACGCVCVGAKSPGIENLIIDGQTGILVEPDAKQIREAVERLLADEKLREHLGKNARDYAVEHFSLDRVYQQYKQVCTELLQG